MKRLIVALALLLATPLEASTYWVRPGGSSGASGVDSTSNAKSLAWFNLNAVAGDTCWLAYGTYTEKIEPRHTGTPSQYIVYIGDVTVPYSRVVASFNIDSTLGATRCISVKGVGTAGDITLKTDSSFTAGYDSITYCVARGQLNVNGRDNVTIRYCTIGTGDYNDKLSVNANMPTGITRWNAANPLVHQKNWQRYRHYFVDSLYIADNTFSFGTTSGSTAMTWRQVSQSQILRNRFNLYGIANNDSHLNTWFDCSNNTVTDNYFWGSVDSSSPMEATYLFNLRDNAVFNTFARDTFVEATGSAKPLKFAFSTSGNDRDDGALPDSSRTFDWGDSNNVFSECFVKVRGYAEIYSKADNNRYLFNTIVLGEGTASGSVGLWMSNYFPTSFPDSNGSDSIVFRHNTVYAEAANGIVIPSATSKLNHSVFAQNIIYSKTPHLATQTRGHYGFNKGSSFTKCDSNLVWSYDPTDSLWAVDLGFLSGGSACKVGTNSTWGQAPYSYDRASKWGSPQLTDSTWLYFDPRPNPAGLAISSNLWADGYCGAIAASADVTAPVVTITGPTDTGRLWATGEDMLLEWTATDAVGLTAFAVQWANTSSPLTWETVASGISSSATSLSWTLPAFVAGYATVRVLGYDAAGNIGTASFVFQCDVEDDERGTQEDVP